MGTVAKVFIVLGIIILVAVVLIVYFKKVPTEMEVKSQPKMISTLQKVLKNSINNIVTAISPSKAESVELASMDDDDDTLIEPTPSTSK